MKSSAAETAAQGYEEARPLMESAIAGTRAEQVRKSKARVNIQKAVGQCLEDQLTKYIFFIKVRWIRNR